MESPESVKNPSFLAGRTSDGTSAPGPRYRADCDTLATDLPGSRRLAYVGIDNRSAGATAAYFLTQCLDTTIHGQALAALTADPAINAVYSIGGGNRAIVQAFADLGRTYRCFVAHDLDADNLALLRAGALSVVLHHDLPTDLHHACQRILEAHRLLPAVPVMPSNLHPVTPYNLPNHLT